MKLFVVVACVLAAFSAIQVRAELFDDVVTLLTNDDFDEHVSSNDFTLSMFYAPWCGHCKRFKPDYAEASQLLEGTASLVGVDCTVEADLCGRFGVKGYPSIKWFSGDVANVRDYDGGRTKKDVLAWIDTQTSPSVTELADAAAVTAFKAGELIYVVGFFDAESKDAKSFAKTAESLRGEAKFGLAPASVAGEFDATSIVLFRSFDEPTLVYDGSVKKRAISQWVQAATFPLVGEIGPDNYKKYMDRGIPLLWLNVDPQAADTEQFVDVAREVAADFNADLSFVILDGVKFESHAQSMGLGKEFPGVCIDAAPKKFLLPASATFDVATFKQFVADWKADKLEPHLKSEPVPEPNDGPVTILVGKNFEDLVINNEKSVLAEFYAPWCGHCKKLEPEYEQLGEYFADNDNIVIAKMDSTGNDQSYVEVKGFPTIAWFAGNNKPNHVSYSGGRDFEGMKKYIEENAPAAPVAAASESHDEL